uniref:Amino acid transporter transmembrane domain-containing protein n=1 Tax=Aegilops tauschii subsp. strangulata TaxID=200361 RepID=A0A452Z861_AEGTS
WDAWFSCASNQVAQVLLTLPYSFSQLGMASGLVLQVFYGLMGSWTAYLISVLYVEYRARKEREGVSFKNHVIQWFEVLDGLLGPYWKAAGLAFNCTFLLFGSVIQLIACASNIYYINDRLDKRTWTYIFVACCATTVFIPSFHNYRIWSFLGLGMTTYTAWYLTIAAAVHGQVPGAKHSGPNSLMLYFTGATNILYTFGGHAVTRDHARDVEAAQVQVHLPGGDAVRVHADAAVGVDHVLGVRRRAAHALQRLLAAPKVRVARRGGHPHAHPPVHHLRLRVHPALLRVGEGHRHAPHRQRPPARARAAPPRPPHLVPRHHLPLLRAHQLRRRRAPRQLHRLRHPRRRPHAHLPLRPRQIECGGEAAGVPAELERDVRGERVRGGVGAGGRVRARRLGERVQLRQADRHLRALRQVLPVSPEGAPPGSGVAPVSAGAPLAHAVEQTVAMCQPDRRSSGRSVHQSSGSPCDIALQTF